MVHTNSYSHDKNWKSFQNLNKSSFKSIFPSFYPQIYSVLQKVFSFHSSDSFTDCALDVLIVLICRKTLRLNFSLSFHKMWIAINFYYIPSLTSSSFWSVMKRTGQRCSKKFLCLKFLDQLHDCSKMLLWKNVGVEFTVFIKYHDMLNFLRLFVGNSVFSFIILS